MSVWMSRIYIDSRNLEKLHDYDPTIDDETWKELNTFAKKLNLHHIKCIYCSANCIFNVFQCQDVLENEMPILKKQMLSPNAKEVVDGLEHALEDVLEKGAHSYLLFEGD